MTTIKLNQLISIEFRSLGHRDRDLVLQLACAASENEKNKVRLCTCMRSRVHDQHKTSKALQCGVDALASRVGCCCVLNSGGLSGRCRSRCSCGLAGCVVVLHLLIEVLSRHLLRCSTAALAAASSAASTALSASGSSGSRSAAVGRAIGRSTASATSSTGRSAASRCLLLLLGCALLRLVGLRELQRLLGEQLLRQVGELRLLHLRLLHLHDRALLLHNHGGRHHGADELELHGAAIHL